MKIYKIGHGCGWGPYGDKYFLTEEKAREQFEVIAREHRRKPDYVKGSYNKEIPEKALYLDTLIRSSWMVGVEYNNENGHEFDEQPEFLTLDIIEVIE